MSEAIQPASVVEALIAKLLNGGQHWMRLQHGPADGDTPLWFASLGDRSGSAPSLFGALLALASVPESDDPGDGPGPDDGTDEDDDDDDDAPGFLAPLDPKGDAS